MRWSEQGGFINIPGKSAGSWFFWAWLTLQFKLWPSWETKGRRPIWQIIYSFKMGGSQQVDGSKEFKPRLSVISAHSASILCCPKEWLTPCILQLYVFSLELCWGDIYFPVHASCFALVATKKRQLGTKSLSRCIELSDSCQILFWQLWLNFYYAVQDLFLCNNI